MRLEVGGFGGAGKWDDVADVLHAGCELDESAEPDAEAGMGYGSVAAEVAVPPVWFGVEPCFYDAFIEDVESFFAL